MFAPLADHRAFGCLLCCAQVAFERVEANSFSMAISEYMAVQSERAADAPSKARRRLLILQMKNWCTIMLSFPLSHDPRSNCLHHSQSVGDRKPWTVSSCKSTERRSQRPLQYLGMNARVFVTKTSSIIARVFVNNNVTLMPNLYRPSTHYLENDRHNIR